jgi:hypothetical protein
MATPAVAAAPQAAVSGKRIEDMLKEFIRTGWRRIDLRLVNAVLLALILCLAIALVAQIVSTSSQLSAMSRKGASLAGLIQQGAGFKDIAAIRGMSYYTEKVSQRNIFKRGARIEEEKKAVDLSPSAKALELTQGLRLVGISWSDDPDAMIENTKSSQTFFIKKGSPIGDLKVEDILKDRIVLRYNKELVELK